MIALIKYFCEAIIMKKSISNMKKMAAASLAAAMLLSMTGCGSTGETAADTEAETTAEAAEAEEAVDAGEENAEGSSETYQIGVLQLVQHDALDEANAGFVEALDASGISYEIDQQNAAGDTPNCTTIAQKFVNDGKDLIFAIATPQLRPAPQRRRRSPSS